MSEELDTAQRYRVRAEELRAIAAEDLTHTNREALEKIAKDYERMARTLEAIDLSNRAMRRPRDAN